MEFLLRHGADPSLKNSSGDTALDIAWDNQNLDIVDVLRQWERGELTEGNPLALIIRNDWADQLSSHECVLKRKFSFVSWTKYFHLLKNAAKKFNAP